MSITLYKLHGKHSTDRFANIPDILVVPTKRRKRHLIRELLMIGGKSVCAPRIFTLELLAREVLPRIYPKYRIVEEPVRTLLFHQAIAESGARFKYFRLRERDNQLPAGTFEKIVNVIARLKESGVYPPHLLDELPSADEDEQPKLQDIIHIYQKYDELLESVNGLDPEGVFKLLHTECTDSAFIQSFREVFPDATTLSIVGFDEFMSPELSFLEKLGKTGIDIKLEFDFAPGNRPLFGHLEENYRNLTEIGFRRERAVAESQEEPRDQLDLFSARQPSPDDAASIHGHVAAHLFKSGTAGTRHDASGKVTLISAKDRIREVELICKIIKELHSANPHRELSRICVAMHRPETYTPLFREQFEKFGIPGNITDRYALAQAPPVVALIAMLEMVVRGFRREDVLRAMSSTYLDFRRDGKSLDRTNLMNISLRHRISAGLKTWVSKINAELERLDTRPPDPDDEMDASRHSRAGADLRRALDDITWLDRLFSKFRRRFTPADFEKELLAILAELGISGRILAAGPGSDSVEKDARALGKFVQVLQQTTRLLEYQGGMDQTHPLKYYVDQLKVALGQERYNVREQFGAGVLVTSIEETRGLPFDVMIVAGLVDGEFPSVYQSEIFLSGKRLKEREQHHVWENRYLFYQAITNFSEHLYLTCPEQDADLDLVRSNFIDALLRILEVREWRYPGNAPFHSAVYSREDFLKGYGSMAGSDATVDVPAQFESNVASIRHALDVELSRTNAHTLPEYEGGIGAAISTETRQKLEELKHRVYSVSQLETYGKCPFQFLAKRLLRLNVVEDLEEEFSPLERGSILHDILFEFYTERRDTNQPLLRDCTEVEFAAAHQRLLEIANAKLSAIDIPDVFWELEKEMIVGDARTGRGMLREFMEHERRQRGLLRPAYFEVGFGSRLGEQSRIDATLSSEKAIVAGQVQLRGKVDRVEVNEGLFSIVDYKTGKVQPKLDEIRKGMNLQLPIYLYTIEQMLTARGTKNVEPVAGLYYQLKPPVGLKVGIGDSSRKDELGIKSNANLLPAEELRKLINEAVSLVNTFVDRIAAGSFPLTAPENIGSVCTFCDYKTTCRIQTVRHVESGKEE